MKEFHWRDKTKHIILSLILSLATLLYFSRLSYALVIISVLSVIKEIYDHHKKNKNTYLESAVDVFYNFVGLGLAYLIYWYFTV